MLVKRSEKEEQLNAVAKTLLNDYLQLYDSISFSQIDMPAYGNNTNTRCNVSGYCTAYIIKFAKDVIDQNEFSFDDFDAPSYADEIRETYSNVDPAVELDVAYGTDMSGTTLGAIGGAAIGGAVGGPVGMLGGALLGGAIGGSSRHTKYVDYITPTYQSNKVRWLLPESESRTTVIDHSVCESRRIS